MTSYQWSYTIHSVKINYRGPNVGICSKPFNLYALNSSIRSLEDNMYIDDCQWLQIALSFHVCCLLKIALCIGECFPDNSIAYSNTWMCCNDNNQNPHQYHCGHPVTGTQCTTGLEMYSDRMSRNTESLTSHKRKLIFKTKKTGHYRYSVTDPLNKNRQGENVGRREWGRRLRW